MCVVDAEAKEAAVARFLREHPEAGKPASAHPALQSCTDAVWSGVAGCPAGIPALFHCLPDQAAGPEAVAVLGNVLMDDIFHVSAAMPAALPFLIGLAADPDIPTRSDVVDLLALAAHLSAPVDADDERSVLLLGHDDDHPERGRCRAAFREHASALRALLDDTTLPDGFLSADDREGLRAAGALR
ncbi:hypothetical protein AB0K23_27050 [Streptomyces sp. NPDC049602]|uniref:hypothetical protein n=1 Tax=Streptomyces sp. NPDC049602 TaxID=3155504 RepID=UPI0034274638